MNEADQSYIQSYIKYMEKQVNSRFTTASCLIAVALGLVIIQSCSLFAFALVLWNGR